MINSNTTALTHMCPHPVFQISELRVSEKDIEKEHHAQLRRWKESRGDLHCKSPPRMHGAKAIMTAEPPSRQYLKEMPSIIVYSPVSSGTDGDRADERGDAKEAKQIPSSPEKANPHLPPVDPSPLLKHTAIDGSRVSLSSAEHDTYL